MKENTVLFLQDVLVSNAKVKVGVSTYKLAPVPYFSSVRPKFGPDELKLLEFRRISDQI